MQLIFQRRRMKGEGFEMENRKSRFAEGRRRRRRKVEMETSFDPFLVHSPDSMADSGHLSSNQDDDELFSLAVRACAHGPLPVPVLVPDPAQEKEKEKEREKPTKATLTPIQPHLSSPLQEATDSALQQENQDPTRNSFTQTLKESQRHYLPESIPLTTRKLLRQRTGSLDLNNSHVSADVASMSSKNNNNFPSPGTPTVYTNRPGWQSERVPLGSQRNRFNGRNRTFNLPSKWEDAERWIFSPVSNETGPVRNSKTQVPKLGQRRPKSKSGPLGSPLSPSSQVFHSGRVGNFAKNSPLWAGVLVPENGIGGTSGTRVSFSNCVSSCSLPSSRGSVQDDRTQIPRKEIGTQTSPCGSSKGSPKMTPSFISDSKSMDELESHFTELEIGKHKANNNDDGGQVTFMRWSKKHVMKGNDKCLTNIIEWKRRCVEEKIKTSCSCQFTETTNCITKIEKEEDKITAWENMQKAKAEAAMQKLLIKLERKKSSSMDKILNKLKFAQKKAQDMRSSNQIQEVPRSTKRVLHCNKNSQITSLSGCFTCHAF
ncbi:hypothetical protein LUZ60_002748 [Juncus effusus]|nr:hypothetical protein LUZ60_002748 [Juncus effusus]